MGLVGWTEKWPPYCWQLGFQLCQVSREQSEATGTPYQLLQTGPLVGTKHAGAPA